MIPAKHTILKHTSTTYFCDQNGFNVIDLVSETDVQNATQPLFKHYKEISEGFFAFTLSITDAIKPLVFDNTYRNFEKRLQHPLKDFKKLGSTFLHKAKGKNGKVGVRQDWYIVDVQHAYLTREWMHTPVTSESKGTLNVLVSSHLFIYKYCCNPIPLGFRGSEQLLGEYMISVPVKTEYNSILNHAILSTSVTNSTPNQNQFVNAYGIRSASTSLHYLRENRDSKAEHIEKANHPLWYHYTVSKRPQERQIISTFNVKDTQAFTYEIQFLVRYMQRFTLGEISGINTISFTDPSNLKMPESLLHQEKTRLTVSIPAYNDAHSLVKLVEDVQAECKKLLLPVHILIINDGSTDNTQLVCAALTDKYNNISVHNHTRNLGFGPTLKEVFSIPKTEWVLFLPGDNQFPASNLALFMNHKDNFDFILGKRKIRKDSLLRIMYAGLYNRLVSLFSGFKVSDVNGIVFFKSSVFDKIQLRTQSSFIHAEFFLEAKRNNYSVAEIDVEHKEREFGKGSGGKWSVIIPSVIDLILYCIKMRWYGY